jgi:hypothetical protein
MKKNDYNFIFLIVYLNMANSKQFESIMFSANVQSALATLANCSPEKFKKAITDMICSPSFEQIEKLYAQIMHYDVQHNLKHTCVVNGWGFCEISEQNHNILSQLGMILEQISISQTGSNDASG